MDGLKFRVGPVVYAVKESEGLHDYNGTLFGTVTYDDCMIQVERSLSDDRKKNVIIHELLHAILNEAGYEEHDEELVLRVGNILTQVLRDNVDTFAELFGTEEGE